MTQNANHGCSVRRLRLMWSAGVAAVSVLALTYIVLSGPSSTHAAAAPSPASLQEHFAVLRQPPGSLPPARLTALVERDHERFGLDLEDVRYSPGADAWLIPGSGWMCIAADGREGIAMSCASAASALAGELALVEHRASDDLSIVLGAAPDGDGQAVAETADGTVTAPVQANTFTLQARALLGVSFR